MELGPSGFAFEDFIAEIFREKGFQAETGKIIKGFCVERVLPAILIDCHTTLLKFFNQRKKRIGEFVYERGFLVFLFWPHGIRTGNKNFLKA